MNSLAYLEETYVLEQFRDAFASRVGRRLALYGIGPNTPAIIDAFPEHAILAVLDATVEGQTMFGLPVVSPAGAADLGVEAIVIVARPSNVPYIHQRIQSDCADLGMSVLTLSGEDLDEGPVLPSAHAAHHWELGEVKALIEGAGAVSFDIFDTLLQRRVYQPADVFALVGFRHFGTEEAAGSFTRERIAAEAEVNALGCPTLEDIYDALARRTGWARDVVAQLAELELSVERDVLMARPALRGLYDHALSHGIPVTLVSDMYLPKEFVGEVLAANGISGHDRLLISGEIGVAKTTGLFDVYRDGLPARTIESESAAPLVHVGDNPEADGVAAMLAGITPVVLPAARDLLAASPSSIVLPPMARLRDRLYVGHLAAFAFEDPFAVREHEGRVRVPDPEHFGLHMLGPLVAEFLHWLVREVEGKGFDRLLFVSRDGYLIQDLYTRIVESRADGVPHGEYLLASRMSSVLASLRTADDVWAAVEMPFDGSVQEMLRNRFLVPSQNIDAPRDGEDDADVIERHMSAILRSAQRARAGYLTYLDRKHGGLPDGAALVDFIASGTSQLALESLAGVRLLGLYFRRVITREEGKAGLSVVSMLEPANAYERGSFIYENYVFLENFFTSPEPSLATFSEGGEPVFLPEPRTAAEIAALEATHRGAARFVQDIEALLPAGVGPVGTEVADRLLGLVRRGYSDLSDSVFPGGGVADEFTNRTFDLSAVVGR